MAGRPAVLAALLLVLGCAIVQLGHESAPLDVNGADVGALAALPGLGPDDAARIVAARPYLAKEDLLRRHVLTERQYAGVERRLVVGPPGTPDYLRSVPPQPEGP